MVALQERAGVLVDDENSSEIYGSYEPVESLGQLYRMLQEGEDDIAQGRVFSKEEALRRIEIESNL